MNSTDSSDRNRVLVNRWDFAVIFVLALLIRLLAIAPVRHPGYMDAAYNYDIALNLVQGQGFVEPFLWNYLDNPSGLPHPSHLYWMPLPTMLAWVGLILLAQAYWAAQVPFAVLSALLPLVSYWVALQTTGRRSYGWLAGLLTLFSGFYLLYWGHTDNFTPFALAGSLSFVATWQAGRAREAGLGGGSWRLRVGGWALAAGALAGLAHLSRADGPLLLIAIGLVGGTSLISNLNPQTAKKVRGWGLGIGDLLFVILGYALVMLPWFARNLAVVGAPLPAAGMQTLWLTTYDDLFSYGRELSLQTFLAWGWSNILRSKLDALWLNTQTLVAVFCMVFLAPLIPLGWWRLRQHRLYQLAAWYQALLFLVMTFVFTFPGPRGGFFHSGGALLPFIFTVALVGLDVFVEWAVARRREWDARMAKQVFSIGLVGLALLFSALVYSRAVFAGQWPHAAWNQRDSLYEDVAAWLAANASPQARVMVNNVPGFYYFSHRPCLSIPNENADVVLSVADRYGVEFLLLEPDHPTPLELLYAGVASHPRLRLLKTFDSSKLFKIVPHPQPNDRGA